MVLRREEGVRARVIAEPVGDRLEVVERVGVGLLFGRVRASRVERHENIDPGIRRGLLHPSVAREHDEVGERHLLAIGAAIVERSLDAFERREDGLQLGGVVDFPILLRSEADAGAVDAAALVAAAEGGCRRPRGRDELRHRQAGLQDLILERRGIRIVDEFVIDGGHRVLPDELFGGHLGSEVAGDGAHVAVRELEPGARERVGESLGVGRESARDLVVLRVDAQREVAREHAGLAALGGIVGEGHHVGAAAVDRTPLVAAGRALR